MNVVLVLIDSCNRHYLEPYGCKTVGTPHIEELAERGVVFDRHFMSSAPCMPARREMMAGRKEFLWRGWGHLEAFDHPLPARARAAGATTMMVTDHYHYWEDGAHGYIEHFDGCEMIRGPEMDFWKTAPQPDAPDWVKAIDRWRPGWGSRYYRNVAQFRDERDFFSPRVFQVAAEWLDANHSAGSFFLQVESFDPHEPFHVPEPYRSMFTRDLKPDYTCWPPYQHDDQRIEFLRHTSPEELAFIRAQYWGKLAMVDKWLGELWRAMDRHGLWKNTVVILTADHGHDLAEAIGDLSEVDDLGRDRTGRVPFGKQHPHYRSHANIPLIICHPDISAGRRVGHLTCATDLYATILDALGVENSRGPHSESLLPLLDGGKARRDLLYWGTFGQGICCTDGEHILLQGARSGAPLYWYSTALPAWAARDPEAVKSGRFIPGVNLPVWRVPASADFEFPSILHEYDAPLFHERNLIEEKPEIAEKLRERLVEEIEKDGCPPEQFERLGLRGGC